MALSNSNYFSPQENGGTIKACYNAPNDSLGSITAAFLNCNSSFLTCALNNRRQITIFEWAISFD